MQFQRCNRISSIRYYSDQASKQLRSLLSSSEGYFCKLLALPRERYSIPRLVETAITRPGCILL